jgi:hypothetical protein
MKYGDEVVVPSNTCTPARVRLVTNNGEKTNDLR